MGIGLAAEIGLGMGTGLVMGSGFTGMSIEGKGSSTRRSSDSLSRPPKLPLRLKAKE